MSSPVGTSVPVADARERVTGQVDYVLNVDVPGMLAGRILRSPHPHARVLRVNAERARRIPGVLAVLTGSDLQHALIKASYGRVFRDQTIVATDRVRFVGEPVAAVAALDEDLADEALEAIEVEYEPLPAVFDPEEALRTEASLLHDRHPLQPGFDGVIRPGPDGSNICSHFTLRRGDVERGFAEADFVFEDTFRSPAVQHVPLEPHVTLAQYKGGALTIWTSTQMPHSIRAQMADLFGLPATRVRVITHTLGGGFGSKGSLRLEPIASVLAWKAGRPVKITLRRGEEFVTVTKHPATIHLKTGVNRDGTLVARQATCYYNTGAYADVGPVVARNAGSAMAGPYKTPHVWVDSYAIWTNIVPAGAFRGFGVSQAAWAYESQMDMMAERLRLDPLGLRLKNVVHDGDRCATGEALADMHYDELLHHVAGAVHWQPSDARWLRQEPEADSARGPVMRRGKGLSVVIKATITPSTSTALAMLNDDGSLQLMSSSVEMGQGAKTVLAQLAAEAADLPYAQVQVSEPDTEVTPYDQQTSSSRTTYSMGRAVVQATRDVKRQLLELAAERLEASVDDLVTHDGCVEVRGVPGRSLSYADVVRGGRRGNLLGQGTFITEGRLDPETGQGIGSVHWHHGAAACEVEVDTETGKVDVVKLSSAVFAGRMVNPRLCELQTEGSSFFGVGQALFEEMLYDNGQVANANLADYMIPSFEDVAGDIDVHIVEHPGSDEIHGLGETSLPPVMPAIANAVYNAVGARVTELPLTPEKVLEALQCRVEDR